MKIIAALAGVRTRYRLAGRLRPNLPPRPGFLWQRRVGGVSSTLRHPVKRDRDASSRHQSLILLPCSRFFASWKKT